MQEVAGGADAGLEVFQDQEFVGAVGVAVGQGETMVHTVSNAHVWRFKA